MDNIDTNTSKESAQDIRSIEPVCLSLNSIQGIYL